MKSNESTTQHGLNVQKKQLEPGRFIVANNQEEENLNVNNSPDINQSPGKTPFEIEEKKPDPDNLACLGLIEKDDPCFVKFCKLLLGFLFFPCICLYFCFERCIRRCCIPCLESCCEFLSRCCDACCTCIENICVTVCT